MDKITHKSYKVKVNFDEADFRNTLKPSSYLQYFQDLAAIHFEELKIDGANMKKKNRYWILSRMSVIIDKPVFKNGNTLDVSTYMRKPGIAEALRDFYVHSGGELCARAVSRWCVLDLDSKRICKCGEFLPFADDAYTNKCAIDISLTKTDLRVAANQTVARNETLKVRHCDLDCNYHMNNARYGDIVFNMCDFDQLNKNVIKGFDLHFVCELMPDEMFSVKRIDYENYSLFEAVKTATGQPAFYAKIEWDILSK